MATAEQIKALIKYHYEKNQERFSTTALQVAAHEARQGHELLADDIRILVDKSKSEVKIISLTNDFSDLIIASEPKDKIAHIILQDDIKLRLNRVIKEYRLQSKIKKYGLSNRRKLLLSGPPGVGKTMTASILAGELSLPLHTIMIDKIMTKFMGETSSKLRKIFDLLYQERAVYLFDEFDAIGAERNRDNDVGEIRRVLNSFLQFIEQDKSDSLIVAATNNPTILDQALYRRFDDVLYYSLPTEEQIKSLINNRLGTFKPTKLTFKKIIEASNKLSHAEIVYACDNAIKEVILMDKNIVKQEVLINMLQERRSAYNFLEESIDV